MIDYSKFKCTPAVRRICEMLIEAKNAESCIDSFLTRGNPGGWWVGTEKVNARAANVLVWTSLVRALDDDWADQEIAYFEVQDYDALRRFATEPDYVPEVIAACLAKERERR